jgi:protease-4
MGGSVQARCLECGGIGPSLSQEQDARLLDLILARVGL